MQALKLHQVRRRRPLAWLWVLLVMHNNGDVVVQRCANGALVH
jgi:hypothetical protein